MNPGFKTRRPWAARCGMAAALGLVLLAGCAQRGPAPLYQWETFPRQQYEALLRDGASADGQITVLEAQAEKARAEHAALPPGFRAHLGMLYLNAGNPQRAGELWQAEKAAFPEATPYMDQLLKRLEKTTQRAAQENPA